MTQKVRPVSYYVVRNTMLPALIKWPGSTKRETWIFLPTISPANFTCMKMNLIIDNSTLPLYLNINTFCLCKVIDSIIRGALTGGTIMRMNVHVPKKRIHIMRHSDWTETRMIRLNGLWKNTGHSHTIIS